MDDVMDMEEDEELEERYIVVRAHAKGTHAPEDRRKAEKNVSTEEAVVEGKMEFRKVWAARSHVSVNVLMIQHHGELADGFLEECGMRRIARLASNEGLVEDLAVNGTFE